MQNVYVVFAGEIISKMIQRYYFKNNLLIFLFTFSTAFLYFKLKKKDITDCFHQSEVGCLEKNET